jgi:two-component system chemotaxis response regulator CheY
MKGGIMKKILIVDDSLFMRMVLKGILSKMEGEYETLEADSGTKALELLKRVKPDLVLLDVIMPEGEEEGVRVLQTIMKNDPESKVVMITAVGQDPVVEQCKKLGAKDYIIKPFDEEQVIETVRKALGD